LLKYGEMFLSHRKMTRIPPLENREQWATLKFKIAQKLARPAVSRSSCGH